MNDEQIQRGIRTSAVLAWMRLVRVFQKVDLLSTQLFREYGLSRAQFDVLAQIGVSHDITQQELAQSLLVTKGNISQLIDRMEQQGIVIRRHEGRTNCLALTEKGQALFKTVVPRQEALLVTLFASLSGEEQSLLLSLLRKLDRSIE